MGKGVEENKSMGQHLMVSLVIKLLHIEFILCSHIVQTTIGHYIMIII